jgi:hypothetical protein
LSFPLSASAKATADKRSNDNQLQKNFFSFSLKNLGGETCLPAGRKKRKKRKEIFWFGFGLNSQYFNTLRYCPLF